MDRIHDEEVDTSEGVLRSLLRDQRPDWAGLPASRIDATGTSNTLWRLQTRPQRPDVVVRLPRQVGADAAVAAEVELLPALGQSPLASAVTLPVVAHRGVPSRSYPMAWMAAEWLDGDDLWTHRGFAAADTRLAVELADAVRTIAALAEVSAPARRTGERGGPFNGVIERLRRWLDDPGWNAAALLDLPAVRRLADHAVDLTGETAPVTFTHGDLIPGNILVDDEGRLAAIIDWGGAGFGDPAQDLAPAWSIFGPTARQVFRDRVDTDDATWHRACITELEHAVGGVLYYRPRKHPLGDVMAATLARILDDAAV